MHRHINTWYVGTYHGTKGGWEGEGCVCVHGRGGRGQEVRGEEVAIVGEEERSTRCIGSGR